MATRTDSLPIGIDDVHAAAERLRGVAHRTPVLTSRTLDERCGGRVFLKAENLQRIGAFKFRGAYNAVTALAPDRGVATASSGNHAQAVALSAALHGLHAVILMPKDAPPSKRAATEGYGAEVLEFDRYGDDRDQMAIDLARDRGLTLVHPYDEPFVMAGQQVMNETGAENAWGFLLDIIHHRGQLTTYLRPMGSTVPQIYGPSADEPM